MMDKFVGECIIKAQMCSDAGKNVWNDYGHPVWRNRAEKFGYGHKDIFIRKAIERILSIGTKRARCSFYVVEDYTYGWDCSIVYFNFKLHQKRYQISFHTFSPKIKTFLTKMNGAADLVHRTRWDEGNSRYSTFKLSEALKCSR